MAQLKFMKKSDLKGNQNFFWLPFWLPIQTTYLC